MNIVMAIILAVVGAVLYFFLNIVIRRMVAVVRSREDYDEDVFNVIDKYCYTSDFDELIFVYGLVCGEFVRQGMMKVEDI